MDSVQETPLKRRKTSNGHINTSQAYDSADDSGDNIFDDFATVATVPLPKNSEQNSTLASLPLPYTTQPTQLLEHTAIPCSPTNRLTVQVAASSPTPCTSSSPAAPKSRGGILSRSMAPPGTAFRHPVAAHRAPVLSEREVIELSDDDGVPYVGGGSSEDDTQRERRDIKPTVISERKRSEVPIRNAPQSPVNGKEKFNRIITSSFFDHGSTSKSDRPASTLKGSVYDSRNRYDTQTTSKITAPKKGSNTMASAYGGTRTLSYPRNQQGPAKAMPVERVREKLEDIEDWNARQKVKRMREVLPDYSIELLYECLLEKRGNYDDAMELALNRGPEAIMKKSGQTAIRDAGSQQDIIMVSDDDELSQIPEPKLPKKPAAKQRLQNPVKSLQEKYSTQRTQPKPTELGVPAIPAKPKRKLMRGRKDPSSPPPPSSSPIVAPKRQSSPISVGDNSDSGIAQSDSEPEKAKLNGSLLEFFNSCKEADLVDVASITDRVAKLVLSHKPFTRMSQIREIVDDEEPAPLTKAGKPKKRGISRRPIGEKILDVCERVLVGYGAIDELVRECQKLSRPVAQEMKKWGIDVYGASSSGELEIVDVAGSDTSKETHDSGIGTPRSTSVSADEDGDGVVKSSTRNKLFPQPKIMADEITLKDYQVVGINWLSLLYKNGLSCILADDMGLGKTCQVIAFLAHLYETGEKGPHIIIVPASVVENWMREFRTFCPKLTVFPYHGSQTERPELRAQIENEEPNVIVTTYTLAKKPEDRKFLRGLRPKVCVYDEGHALKNQGSQTYTELMRIRCEFRILLTGTPLQNNLNELASLLGFILPDLFKEHKDELDSIFSVKATTKDETHGALLSTQRIDRARSMMTPFILRRKKHQVLKHLPKKTKRTEYCEMTESQKRIYDAEWERNQKALSGRARGDKDAEKPYNALIALRKAAIHPMLMCHHYDEDRLRAMAKAYMVNRKDGSNENLVYEDLWDGYISDFQMQGRCDEYAALIPFKIPGEPWMNSGKVEKLVSLLLEYQSNGERVLIFSQMTMVMDILEEVLNTVNVKFCRLDGDTKITNRQELIDMFYRDTSITAFMLSTKAGGAGINLAAANKVIIFDSGYNPQDDIQAENRAHRVGQTRDVEVVRLVTKGTIEEAIHALGETKLALDERVAATDDDGGKKVEKEGMKRIREVMEEQAKKAMAEK